MKEVRGGLDSRANAPGGTTPFGVSRRISAQPCNAGTHEAHTAAALTPLKCPVRAYKIATARSNSSATQQSKAMRRGKLMKQQQAH